MRLTADRVLLTLFEVSLMSPGGLVWLKGERPAGFDTRGDVTSDGGALPNMDAQLGSHFTCQLHVGEHVIPET